MRDQRLLTVLYVMVWLLFHFVFDPAGWYPVVTPGWTGRHFLWFAGLTSAALALLGKTKAAYVSLGAFLLGNVLGEWLGGFEENIAPCYRHHGWWIAVATFLAGVPAGLRLERKQP